MDKCLYCDYARRACNTDYIGCAYWDVQINKDLNYMTHEQVMDELDLDSLATGWVYLGRRPEHETAPDVTASASVMTNGVVCFEKDFVCKKFKSRLNFYREE